MRRAVCLSGAVRRLHRLLLVVLLLRCCHQQQIYSSLAGACCVQHAVDEDGHSGGWRSSRTDTSSSAAAWLGVDHVLLLLQQDSGGDHHPHAEDLLLEGCEEHHDAIRRSVGVEPGRLSCVRGLDPSTISTELSSGLVQVRGRGWVVSLHGLMDGGLEEQSAKVSEQAAAASAVSHLRAITLAYLSGIGTALIIEEAAFAKGSSIPVNHGFFHRCCCLSHGGLLRAMEEDDKEWTVVQLSMNLARLGPSQSLAALNTHLLHHHGSRRQHVVRRRWPCCEDALQDSTSAYLISRRGMELILSRYLPSHHHLPPFSPQHKPASFGPIMADTIKAAAASTAEHYGNNASAPPPSAAQLLLLLPWWAASSFSALPPPPELELDYRSVLPRLTPEALLYSLPGVWTTTLPFLLLTTTADGGLPPHHDDDVKSDHHCYYDDGDEPPWAAELKRTFALLPCAAPPHPVTTPHNRSSSSSSCPSIGSRTDHSEDGTEQQQRYHHHHHHQHQPVQFYLVLGHKLYYLGTVEEGEEASFYHKLRESALEYCLTSGGSHACYLPLVTAISHHQHSACLRQPPHTRSSSSSSSDSTTNGGAASSTTTRLLFVHESTLLQAQLPLSPSWCSSTPTRRRPQASSSFCATLVMAADSILRLPTIFTATSTDSPPPPPAPPPPPPSVVPVAGFLHVTTVGPHWLAIARDQYRRLSASGLLHYSDSLHVGLVAPTQHQLQEARQALNLPPQPPPDKKVHVHETHGAPDQLYEYPTLLRLEEWCHQHPDGRVYYLHGKGVTAAARSLATLTAVTAWRHLMEHFIVDRFSDCVRVLDEGWDSCGALGKDDGTYRYYAGNFWWSTCRHINSLPSLARDFNLTNRYWAEVWVGLSDAWRPASCLGDVDSVGVDMYVEEVSQHDYQDTPPCHEVVGGLGLHSSQGKRTRVCPWTGPWDAMYD